MGLLDGVPATVVATTRSHSRPGQAVQDAPRDPEEVRQLADEILSRPEFADGRSLLDRFLDWLGRQLGGGDPTDPAGGGVVDGLGWVVVLVLAALVLYVLARSRHWTPRRRPDDAATTIAVEERRPPSRWLADAERLEAAGAWKEGIRCRYRALVATLVETGVLDDVAGRTNGEHRADVEARAPAVAAAFAEATELFERPWYGAQSTGPAEAARFAASAAAVVQGATERRRQDALVAAGGHQ